MMKGVCQGEKCAPRHPPTALCKQPLPSVTSQDWEGGHEDAEGTGGRGGGGGGFLLLLLV